MTIPWVLTEKPNLVGVSIVRCFLQPCRTCQGRCSFFLAVLGVVSLKKLPVPASIQNCPLNFISTMQLHASSLAAFWLWGGREIHPTGDGCALFSVIKGFGVFFIIIVQLKKKKNVIYAIIGSSSCYFFYSYWITFCCLVCRCKPWNNYLLL